MSWRPWPICLLRALPAWRVAGEGERGGQPLPCPFLRCNGYMPYPDPPIYTLFPGSHQGQKSTETMEQGAGGGEGWGSQGTTDQGSGQLRSYPREVAGSRTACVLRLQASCACPVVWLNFTYKPEVQRQSFTMVSLGIKANSRPF